MMKRILLTYLIFALITKFLAQTNLVPNPSFESYTSCPNTSYQINFALGWSEFRNTPDYFNSCSSQFSGVKVPNTEIGFQKAASGNAYSGFYSYAPNSAQSRESLGSTLYTPLIIGTKYFVAFKINLCQIDSAMLNNCATDHIGALFSTNQYNFNSPSPVGNFAHVYSNSIISDTANWTTIKGSFIADSAYKYISIGNFFDDANTNKKIFFVSSTYAAYYFVDDICVSTDSTFTETWTGVNEIKKDSSIRIYPNPSDDIAILDLDELAKIPLVIDIYNSLGQVVFRTQTVNQKQIKFNLIDFPSGVYVFTLTNLKEQVFKQEKLIKKNNSN